MILFKEEDKGLAKKVIGEWMASSELPYRFFTPTDATLFCQSTDQNSKGFKVVYYNLLTPYKV